MARAGRGQPTNTLISNNITTQPTEGPLVLVVYGDLTETFQGVTAFATQASLATGILNQIFDNLTVDADGATNHGELAETLANVRSTARGANLNVTVTPGPSPVGHGKTGLHQAQHRHGIELLTTIGTGGTPPSTSSSTAHSFILLESGDNLLLESGYNLLLEIENG